MRAQKTKEPDPHRIIKSHPNTYSIKFKFESLVRFVINNLDIPIVSETKIDDTFPIFNSRFFKTAFTWLHSQGGGILLYVREDIPCRYIKQITLNNSFEGFFAELNLRSRKWFLGCSYNHHKDNVASHLSTLSVALDKLCTDYENIIILGDFNVEVKEKICLTS